MNSDTIPPGYEATDVICNPRKFPDPGFQDPPNKGCICWVPSDLSLCSPKTCGADNTGFCLGTIKLDFKSFFVRAILALNSGGYSSR